MDTHPAPPLEALVAAVVDFGGPLSSIVAHMVAYEEAGHSAHDAAAIPVVLASLLLDTLDPLRDELPVDHLMITANVLDRVCELMSSEILLVDPGAGEDG